MGLNDDLADTADKDKDHGYYRIRVDIRRNRNSRSGTFSNTIVHELLHVQLYRCGVPSPHHDPGTKARTDFYKRAANAEKYLRERSQTLRLFESWLKATRSEIHGEPAAAKAAENALQGNSPPAR